MAASAVGYRREGGRLMADGNLACLFRVQPDEPGELEAEVKGQPVTSAAQVDPGYLFRLLQPVVQRAAVQAEPLGARLRIAGPPDRRSDPRRLLRLAVGATGVGEDRPVADSGYHRRPGVAGLQAQQQAGTGGIGFGVSNLTAGPSATSACPSPGP